MDLQRLRITGMAWGQDHLWLASPENSLVLTYDPISSRSEIKLTYSHPVVDVCPSAGGIWLIAGGGTLGQQCVLWSEERAEELRRFNCPEGAASGITVREGMLWLTHRRHWKLFCLDPQDGKTKWVIRTEKESFSPTFHDGELWLIETEPGPLGHWGRPEQARVSFIRYDVARERVVERIPAPFDPSCIAFDGKRFWYAEREKLGFSSIPCGSLAGKSLFVT